MRPRLIQVAWGLTALLVLGVQGVAAFASFTVVKHPCVEPNCNGVEITRHQMEIFRDAGITLQTFAAYYDAINVGIAVLFCAVAGLIIWRRSGDMMAVLASFTLLLFGGMTLPSTYATVAATYPLWDWPLSLLAGLGAVLLTVFVLLFPDGRLALRWPAAVVGVWSLSIMGSYLAPGTVVDSDTYPTIIAGPLFLSVFPALVYSQIYRYRRVSTPVQRQQTKWVVAGIGSAFVVFIATVILGDLPNVNDSAVGVLILPTISYAALAFIPISIALAVLRYGLWNIDVLINRALVYGSLTLALAAIYLGSVIVISLALRQVAGQDSGLAVAVSTLIVAALFGPLRRRFQAAIDRHFYRQKYNAARTLSTFGSALRDQVDMDELQGSLLSIVHTTMQPAHVSLQIFDGREKR